jgi:BirA family biotin operon repressor/biotin-[acetyl-CoA-carboxylase] ligase
MIWRVEHFHEIDSTNIWLVDQALEGAAEGLVAFADFQTAGRGRLERGWEAPPGSSLLCSVLLRPVIDPDQLMMAVAAVALSLRAALVRLCGVRPDLKWPNDLLVGDAKLAGLLAEVVSTYQGLAVVVGFGVNLTKHPDAIAATSVFEASGVNVSPRGLLDFVLEELEARRGQLDSAAGRANLRVEYESALVTLGQRVRIELRDGAHVGEALRIDESGRLVVDVEGVGVMTFAVGDVVHLRPYAGDV